MRENFKTIDEFPDYEIGDKGTIISHRNGSPKILQGKFDKDGYKEYQLRSCDGKRKYRRGHRLVGFAFLGKPPTSEHVINHKNGIKDDNRLENLEWVTISENTLHGFRELGRLPSKHSNISTIVYTKEHEIVGIFPSNKEAAEFLNISLANLCKNRKDNDLGKRHNRGCGIYLIHKKYYCKTYSLESVETIEQDIESA